ncbi:MAG TPA: CDP-alcohol phosphatidyltransferase family protein [Candidatus Limnocylindrales bacterium]|nr:CDP-alcohol phosphatidyltransferase family protein [Candidatus Limnocylindrales bacterium]
MSARPSSAQSPTVAAILGRCPVRLWGLTGEERLARQLRAAGVQRVLLDAPPESQPMLLVRADFLFDARTLHQLLAEPGTILEARDGAGRTVAVAANVSGTQIAPARDAIENAGPSPSIDGVAVQTAAELRPSYIAGLLKADRPLLLPIRADRVAELEAFLFDASYKGVTDLVTKWVWPLPARWTVRLCTRLGIRPNAVTATGLILVLAATWLFWHGHFAAGLVPAWLMTFLDTVDGKLARVTVTSSSFGHYLDHVTDLVHPPLWYAAWGAGIVGGAAHLDSLSTTLYWILAGYIGGRLAEGAFKHFVAGFSMFTWQPFDSYFRLVTGRRNPNLLLLTGSLLVTAPAAGLTAVAVWTVASTVILLVRLVQGAAARLRGERLTPWLEAIDPDAADRPRYAQPFTPDGAALARLTR